MYLRSTHSKFTQPYGMIYTWTLFSHDLISNWWHTYTGVAVRIHSFQRIHKRTDASTELLAASLAELQLSTRSRPPIPRPILCLHQLHALVEFAVRTINDIIQGYKPESGHEPRSREHHGGDVGTDLHGCSISRTWNSILRSTVWFLWSLITTSHTKESRVQPDLTCTIRAG